MCITCPSNVLPTSAGLSSVHPTSVYPMSFLLWSYISYIPMSFLSLLSPLFPSCLVFLMPLSHQFFLLGRPLSFGLSYVLSTSIQCLSCLCPPSFCLCFLGPRPLPLVCFVSLSQVTVEKARCRDPDAVLINCERNLMPSVPWSVLLPDTCLPGSTASLQTPCSLSPASLSVTNTSLKHTDQYHDSSRKHKWDTQNNASVHMTSAVWFWHVDTFAGLLPHVELQVSVHVRIKRHPTQSFSCPSHLPIFVLPFFFLLPKSMKSEISPSLLYPLKIVLRLSEDILRPSVPPLSVISRPTSVRGYPTSVSPCLIR